MSKLFSDFNKVSKQEWLDKIKVDLKGNDINALYTEIDGIKIDPFGHSDDLEQKYDPIPKSREGWEHCELVNVNGIPAANKIARKALNGGAAAIEFHFREGLKDLTLNQFLLLFRKIRLDYISVIFSGFYNADKLLPVIEEYINIEEVHDQKPTIYFKETEPLRTSQLAIFDYHYFASVDYIYQTYTKFYKDLRYAENPQEIADRSFFEIQIKEHYFLNMAAIRAAKIGLQNIAALFGIKDFVPFVEISLSKNEDAEVAYNYIRRSVQSLAALSAGVDRIRLNEAGVEQDDHDKRINRNISNLYHLEGFVDRVTDPSTGSYHVEQLTDQLLYKNWKIFLDQAGVELEAPQRLESKPEEFYGGLHTTAEGFDTKNVYYLYSSSRGARR